MKITEGGGNVHEGEYITKVIPLCSNPIFRLFYVFITHQCFVSIVTLYLKIFSTVVSIGMMCEALLFRSSSQKLKLMHTLRTTIH